MKHSPIPREEKSTDAKKCEEEIQPLQQEFDIRFQDV
jgi:hypothetical protein